VKGVPGASRQGLRGRGAVLDFCVWRLGGLSRARGGWVDRQGQCGIENRPRRNLMRLKMQGTM
jgi:hypothetical protein